MTNTLLPILAALIALSLSPGLHAMSQAEFEEYVWGRAGGGEVIHRVSTGYAYESTTGKRVSRMEGHEIAIAIASETEPGTIYHIARAVVLYRDPDTDAVQFAYPSADAEAMTAVNAYSRDADGGFVWRLGRPYGDGPPRTMPGTVACERQGSVLQCLRDHTYTDAEGTTVLEYRWLTDRSATTPEAAARIEFAEIEPPNPKLAEGRLLIRLSSYRAADWQAVPESLRSWIETDAPDFAKLPDDPAALIEAAGFAP